MAREDEGLACPKLLEEGLQDLFLVRLPLLEDDDGCVGGLIGDSNDLVVVLGSFACAVSLYVEEERVHA